MNCTQKTHINYFLTRFFLSLTLLKFKVTNKKAAFHNAAFLEKEKIKLILYIL